MKNKSTIITLLDTPAFGGAEQYVLDSSILLNKNGNKIIIYTNNKIVKEKYLEFLSKYKIKNFEVHELPYLLDAIGNWKGLVKFFFHAPKACLWFYKTLKQKLIEEKNDGTKIVCLFVGYTDRLLFSPIVKKLGAKLIWVDIGPLGPVFERTWGFPKFLYHATKIFPDHFTTTSKFTLSTMLELGKIPKDKISLVYPGTKIYPKTSLEEFKKNGKKSLRNHLKRINKKPKQIVGYVGRMASENQVDILIEAFKILVSKTDSRIHLVLMGDGPEKIKFEKLAKTLKIADMISFLGFVSVKEKFSILSVCDIFVYPRTWEWDGFGITTIEAMSVGTPVLSPRFGPQMEIVNDNKNGLNFDPLNTQDLAEKMLLLLENQQMRNNFSRNGLKTVKKNFSYKKMEKSLLEAVQKVT